MKIIAKNQKHHIMFEMSQLLETPIYVRNDPATQDSHSWSWRSRKNLVFKKANLFEIENPPPTYQPKNTMIFCDSGSDFCPSPRRLPLLVIVVFENIFFSKKQILSKMNIIPTPPTYRTPKNIMFEMAHSS